MPGKALALARQRGAIRLRHAVEQGIHPEVLRRLVAAGELIRTQRGIYELPGREITEHTDLAVAAMRGPHGVVCLLSALAYHRIGTQRPHEVWMMIPARSHRPRVERPQMRFITASGPSLTEGVDSVKIEGQAVKVYNPTKTVVDCFRYRRHVGLDVALEAMREVLRFVCNFMRRTDITCCDALSARFFASTRMNGTPGRCQTLGLKLST